MRILYTLTLLLISILLANYAMAYDFSAVCSTGQTLYYGITNEEPYTVKVTHENSSSPYYSTYPTGDLEIPESVEYNGITYSVISIGMDAFYGCSELTSVAIPNSVTIIDRYAFQDCSSLTSVRIGNSVTEIGEKAFYNCSGLISVSIPNSVTYIGTAAFYGCSSLTEPLYNANCFAYFPCGYATEYAIRDGIKQIAGEAFFDCSDLTDIIIPNSVTSIGDAAFSYTGWYTAQPDGILYMAGWCLGYRRAAPTDTLNIEEGTIGIADNAFSNCSELTSVTIPNSVKYFCRYAFYDCSGLTSVNYAGDIAGWCGISFEEYYSNPLYYAHNLYINDELVTDLVIPETISEINDRAFNNATCLTSVYFPNVITSIGSEAFSGCSGLTGDLIIPNSVTSIGKSAFSNCAGITSVTIYNSVNSFGSGAFSRCSGIISFRYIGSLSEWCGIDFYDISANPLWNADNFYVNDELVTDLVIPDDVTEIKNYAFSGAECFVSLTISNSVSRIGTRAFFYCTLAGDLTIPNSVTSIGEEAFARCSSLNGTLTIGNSVERISNGAFDYCENIAGINIGANTPPVLGENCFTETTYNSATLWTPCSLDETYRNNSQWGQFTDIRNDTTDLVLTVQTADANMGSVTGSGSYSCETETTITATPSTGYRFVSWNDDNTENPRTVIVTSDITFTAGFRAIHTITASAGEGGSIDPNGDVTVDDGENQSFTITANEHYRIASVLVDDVDASEQVVNGVYTFEHVSADHTINATFEEKPIYTISVLSNNDAYGSASGGGTYEEDTQVDIAATPYAGYRFVSWDDDNTENPRTIIVTSDSTFTAVFRAIHTITATAGEGGSIDPNGDVTIDDGENQSFTITANEHYRIASVLVDDVDASEQVVNGVYTFEHVSADHTINATFEEKPIYTISVLSNNDAYGSASGGGTYEEDTQVDIAATPYAGYRFVSWDDDNTENPRTIIVTSDSTFTAVFRAIHTITATAGEGGSIDPNGDVTIDDGENQSFTITANEHYRIASVLVDDVDATEQVVDGVYTFENVVENHTINATFEAIAYTITVLSSNDAYGSVSGGGTYEEDTQVVITATPYAGYSFISWNDDNTDNSRTISVTSDSTFVANFTKCEITYAIDTIAQNFVTVGDHTFYSTGRYSFEIRHENNCDTIFDINLTVLAEPEPFIIEPNPAKSFVNIHSDEFISFVEIYSSTGQLALHKEVNSNFAECDVESLVPGIYIVRLHGEAGNPPSIQRFVKE